MEFPGQAIQTELMRLDCSRETDSQAPFLLASLVPLLAPQGEGPDFCSGI